MTTIRILGSNLDVDEYFVDVDVTNVSLDGDVELTGKANDVEQTWTKDLDELAHLRNVNLAATHEDLTNPKHELWKTLQTLYERRNDEVVANAADEIGENAESMFQLLIEANTTGDDTTVQ